jgi:hypothetical protein
MAARRSSRPKEDRRGRVPQRVHPRPRDAGALRHRADAAEGPLPIEVARPSATGSERLVAGARPRLARIPEPPRHRADGHFF